jgi:hypothetical protein
MEPRQEAVELVSELLLHGEKRTGVALREELQEYEQEWENRA